MSGLRLRPFRPADEAPARAAHEALMRDDGFPFLLDYADGEPWEPWLRLCEAFQRGEELPESHVPASFLAAQVGGELVGRVSIRHQLNDWLALYGGHIGYAVVPDQRRRGYGTEILGQALVVARAFGVEDILIACDVGNLASARTIEACGGEFESEADGDEPGVRIRRYWLR